MKAPHPMLIMVITCWAGSVLATIAMTVCVAVYFRGGTPFDGAMFLLPLPIALLVFQAIRMTKRYRQGLLPGDEEIRPFRFR